MSLRPHDPQDAREIRVTFGALFGAVLASCIGIGIATLIVVASAHVFLGVGQ